MSCRFGGLVNQIFAPGLSFVFDCPNRFLCVYRTPFGLRLRSVGEAPQAAASVGVNVMRMRYTAVILSGVLAGLAGAYLSIGNLDKFNRGMSANQGFIALAALIFGKWLPWNTMGACLLFGFFKALAICLGGGDFLPSCIDGNVAVYSDDSGAGRFYWTLESTKSHWQAVSVKIN